MVKKNNNPKNKRPAPKRKISKAGEKGNIKKFKKANINDLQWKTVEITKDDTAALNMEDLQGFYGLEELDNVKLVKDEKTGKVEFLVKEDQVKTEKTHDAAEEEILDMNEQFGEFKNIDDFEEGELSALESDDLDQNDISENEELDEENNDELNTKVFQQVIDHEKILEQDLDNDIDYSIAVPKWLELGCEINKHVLNRIIDQKFKEPSEIQKEVLPLIINKNANVIGKANTGSGKTLAYSIPILNELFEQMANGQIHKSEDPIGIIFTPTRELATQVTKVMKSFIPKNLNENVVLPITGGLAIQKQERLLLNYPKSGNGKIIITTPGRFLEILGKNKDLVVKFSKIKYLVLDEADRLLQDGHFDEFIKIYELLYNKNKEILKKTKDLRFWQTLIFSATFQLDLFNKLENGYTKNHTKKDSTDEKEQIIQHLMAKIHFHSKPVFIDCNPTNHLLPSLKELKIECLPMERNLYLYYILTVFPENSIIFTNSIETCKKLHVFLNNLNIDNHIIHSKMLQKKRLQNLENFTGKVNNKKDGKPTVLIASDVAARGLDIPNIKHVIHYHLPKTADTYIHRSGRTLRGKTQDQGFSLMILSPQEAMGPLRKLRKTLSGTAGEPTTKKMKWQNTIDSMVIQDDLVSQLKDRVELANELTEHEISNKSVKKDDSWLKQAANDLGIDDGDSDDEMNAKNLLEFVNGKKDHHLKRNQSKKFSKIKDSNEISKLKYQLKQSLSTPIRYNMRQKYLTSGLVNYADQIVKNKGHESVMGLQKMNLADASKRKNKKKNLK
ncbi:hypothetical protein ACO0OL_000358 [Hanseniaspora opuntiae]